MRVRHAGDTTPKASCSAKPPQPPTWAAPRRQQDLGAAPGLAIKTRPTRGFQRPSAKKLAQHAQKHRNWSVLSALGELFRAYATKHRRRANFFAHRTHTQGDDETNNTTAQPQHGTTETGIASAPGNCTINANFSPAKAMAVSIPHRHKQAKAITVSNHRATSSATHTAPVGGGGAWPHNEPTHPATHQYDRRRRCGGRRRDRRARAGFEARRRTK